MFLLLSLIALLGASVQTVTAQSTKLTTLRERQPQGVFKNIGGVTYIVDGNVEVRNVGTVPAENVRVMLELPEGAAKQLRGPSTIPPNKTITYRSRLFDIMTSTKKLKVSTSCSNCR